MSKIVERTLDFLELFAEQRRPLSLSEISRLLKIPVSSSHDVLKALEARGYMYELSPRGGFYPSLRLLELGRTIAAYDPVVQRAEGALRALRDRLDESVLLAKVSGMRANYVLTFEPSHPLRFLAKVGDSIRSLHATSAGKALLARLDERALDAWLAETTLTSMTSRTILTAEQLREDLAIGRQRGYFLNRDESQDGVTTMSAPFDWNGSLYIVTIAGPTSRLEPMLETAASLMVDACSRLQTQTEF
jgi:DNA-binding IclR family transcriptional regulator